MLKNRGKRIRLAERIFLVWAMWAPIHKRLKQQQNKLSKKQKFVFFHLSTLEWMNKWWSFFYIYLHVKFILIISLFFMVCISYCSYSYKITIKVKIKFFLSFAYYLLNAGNIVLKNFKVKTFKAITRRRYELYNMRNKPFYTLENRFTDRK